MTPFDLVVLALAAHRLADLWFEKITEPLRNILSRGGAWAAYLAGCPRCISVWMAGVAVGLWAIPSGRVVDGVLAISALAMMLKAVVDTVVMFPTLRGR